MLQANVAIGQKCYSPYRRVLLTPSRIKELSTLRPRLAMADIAKCWILILAAGALVATHPTWWAVLIAVPVIGNRYYALFIIGHDAMHRRLFPTVKRNDFWADLLIFAPIGAITRLNNRNHLGHHMNLATPQDPDRFKHACFNKGSRQSLLAFLAGLTSVLYAAKAVFVSRGEPNAGNNKLDGYTLRDFALLAGWFLILAGGLTLFVGWWAYPVIWLFPVYTFMYLADNFRSFVEHSHPEGDQEADSHRLITYLSSPLERILIAPMNMNYHAAHHLWPSIPYYNLPTADQEIRHPPNPPDWNGATRILGICIGIGPLCPLLRVRRSVDGGSRLLECDSASGRVLAGGIALDRDGIRVRLSGMPRFKIC